MMGSHGVLDSEFNEKVVNAAGQMKLTSVHPAVLITLSGLLSSATSRVAASFSTPQHHEQIFSYHRTPRGEVRQKYAP